MPRVLIGITSGYDLQENKYSLQRLYVDKVSSAGALPVILPIAEDNETMEYLVNMCDGFVFTGGSDFSPTYYGEEILECCGAFCPPRDDYEYALMKKVVEKGKALLAICRGMQLLNVVCGGSLYQDIAACYNTELCHRMIGRYGETIHSVKLENDSVLFDMFGETEIAVNSYHHQAVKTLGRGIRAIGTASDGIIEAIALKDRHFSVGVQWHPELLDDVYSHRLFSALANKINI